MGRDYRMLVSHFVFSLVLISLISTPHIRNSLCSHGKQACLNPRSAAKEFKKEDESKEEGQEESQEESQEGRCSYGFEDILNFKNHSKVMYSLITDHTRRCFAAHDVEVVAGGSRRKVSGD